MLQLKVGNAGEECGTSLDLIIEDGMRHAWVDFEFDLCAHRAKMGRGFVDASERDVWVGVVGAEEYGCGVKAARGWEDGCGWADEAACECEDCAVATWESAGVIGDEACALGKTYEGDVGRIDALGCELCDE